jgi:hypothetical protein
MPDLPRPDPTQTDQTQTDQTQTDTQSSDPSDPFDPANLRYDPSDTAHTAERIWTPGQISLRKPRSQEFFRAHHDLGFQLLGATLELKDEREYYFVTPNIATAYPYEVKPVLFCLVHQCLRRCVYLACPPTGRTPKFLARLRERGG